MLESLTAATFEPHRGTDFAVQVDGEEARLRLVEVRAYPHQPRAPRTDPFSLQFVGPAQPALDQRIHRLEHPDLGVLELFLVPTGLVPGGERRYEAVFN